MHAPDDHVALQYLRAHCSIIPLAAREKRPNAALLPNGQWSPFQTRRPTPEEVEIWTHSNPNWGIVCGRVSDGLICGDCDDEQFSAWILEHASDPVFRGACVVRTGSGKAHVWFRSPNLVVTKLWKPARGKKFGDIRGDGNGTAGPSYAAVPPSIHPSGEPYVKVAGSFSKLPMIENGDAFLDDIAAAYLATHPEEAPPPQASNDKHFYTLVGEDQIRVVVHVQGLKLKKRIEDTIIKPGNQDPDSPHWIRTRATSHSDIDYAVCCELIRKGQTYKQVEEIFAACVVGDYTYRNASRGNHGYAYLSYTYGKAKVEVERERQATRIATGSNFKVTHTRRTVLDKDKSLYRLQVECTRADGSMDVQQVDLEDEDLLSLDRTKRAFIKQTHFVPVFFNNQQGRHFAETFGQAVMDSVVEEVGVLESHTHFGMLATALRRQAQNLPEGTPPDIGQAHSLGWHIGDTYYLRAMAVNAILRGYEHSFKAEEARRVLDLIDPHWEPLRWAWPAGQPEDVVRLVFRHGTRA